VPAGPAASIVAVLEESRRAPMEAMTRYFDGRRQLAMWTEIPHGPQPRRRHGANVASI